MYRPQLVQRSMRMLTFSSTIHDNSLTIIATMSPNQHLAAVVPSDSVSHLNESLPSTQAGAKYASNGPRPNVLDLAKFMETAQVLDGLFAADDGTDVEIPPSEEGLVVN